MATLHFPFPRDGAFDPDTIRVMSSAFEAAWHSLHESGVTLGNGSYSDHATREMLARCIIEMAKAGVRDQRRPRNAALKHFAQNSRRAITGEARLESDQPCSPKAHA